jgi:5-carboxymethyl-2-hydroxymuconate isomerase
MPHIHLEYSDNVQFEVKPILLAINQAFIQAGYATDPSDVKSRAVCQSDHVIGLELDNKHAYVHAKVSLLSGRSDELKAAIADLVLDTLSKYVPNQAGLNLQFCVELIDMPKSCYRKTRCQ